MANSVNGTSIWVDCETAARLRRLAELKNRSVAGQIRHMVALELSQIEGEQAAAQPGNGKVQSGDCED